MTTIALEHAREDAKTIVKVGMEKSQSIDAYTDEGQRIVGKQEASLTGGNGARLIVDIPEMQQDDDETVIEVSAEKEMSLDQSTNPEDIKSEFLNIVNRIRHQSVDSLLQDMSQSMSPVESKEVTHAGEFGNDEATMGAKFIITFVVLMVFTILFGLIMTSMMMP